MPFSRMGLLGFITNTSSQTKPDTLASDLNFDRLIPNTNGFAFKKDINIPSIAFLACQLIYGLKVHCSNFLNLKTKTHIITNHLTKTMESNFTIWRSRLQRILAIAFLFLLT